jgi:hypothetical protein
VPREVAIFIVLKSMQGQMNKSCRREFMRDNWPSNRIFKSYDDLVDHCCEAWNKLVNQPWRIMSIGLRQRAHEF